MKIAGNINLKNRAATQFLDYDFNAFCNHKGRQLATGPDGLFVLGADDDDGTAIAAWIETVLSAWGMLQNKRPRFGFLYYQADGSMTVSVLNGKLETMGSKTVAPNDVALPETKQFSWPRTTAGRYWKFKIGNVAGADFSIEGLDVFFTVRPHGVSQTT